MENSQVSEISLLDKMPDVYRLTKRCLACNNTIPKNQRYPYCSTCLTRKCDGCTNKIPTNQPYPYCPVCIDKKEQTKEVEELSKLVDIETENCKLLSELQLKRIEPLRKPISFFENTLRPPPTLEDFVNKSIGPPTDYGANLNEIKKPSKARVVIDYRK